MNKNLAIILLSIFILLQNSTVGSFEVNTHRTLSTRSVDSSNLDNFLKIQLGLPEGINEVFSGKRVFEWVEEGSEREDDEGRFFNHFHNPLQAWNQAGLRILMKKKGTQTFCLTE